VNAPLLELEGVSIAFGNTTVVDRLSLTVRAGERVALVGESGSGKTVTALSILRLLPAARISGSIRLDGADLVQKTDAQIRRVRGADVAMIFQEPMTALNPLYTIGEQVAETLVLHEGLGRRLARERAIELLSRTGLREPARRVDAFPHQLSGGERQRAMIAMALACRPRLLIADEPTTALDLTIRARIVELLLDLQQEERARGDGQGMAILLITHDLPLVRRFAERVAVMEHGKLVEAGSTEGVFRAPQHPYTKKLLGSTPQRSLERVAAEAPTLLQTSALRVEYAKAAPGLRGWFRPGRFVALAGADISLREGETVGVVGESGSGKSTLAQAILGLIRVHSGDLAFEGVPLSSIDTSGRRSLRARLQVVFQDPFGSLSPRHTVRQIVGEGLDVHYPELSEQERDAKVEQVLGEVGLPPSALDAYPHEFSGGQRQRIAIARALVISPRVLVLDEPTSALDVSIQSQVLALLLSLQRKYRLSYVLISHDLTVVQAMAHRIYVVKDGEIVESGETEAVITSPQHPYTKRLVQASLPPIAS
jgi:microcin C transport system ATP-binding protein